MDEERFREFIDEVIPQQLFHVEPTDIDDETGAQLDEMILVGLIAKDPSCLKHKPLQWFLDHFLIKTDEEKELFCQIIKDERESENTVDIFGDIDHQVYLPLLQIFHSIGALLFQGPVEDH